MKHLSYRIIILVIFYPWGLIAQPNKILPVSPEAAALAKMVNYPVNLNTGIPDISIPLHEIRVGGMVLPIALQYHAGGFRINEQATRAGLGWSLTSDLQITRSVNGLDDIKASVGYLANTFVKSKDTLYYSDANAYPLNSVTPFPYRNQYDIAMGEKDGSPDKFNYKLPNKSGSFYFQKDNTGTGYTIVPVPYNDIEITWNQGQFKIVDTDGTVYFFGSVIPSGGWDTDDAVSLGFEVTGQIGIGTCIDCIISSWKCKQIVNATGTSQIDFEYEKKAVAQFRTYQDKIEYYYNGQNPSAFRPYYRSDQYPINNANSYEHLLQSVDLWSVSTPKWMEHTAKSRRFHVPYVNSTTGTVTDKIYPVTQGVNYTSISVGGLALKQITYSGGRVLLSGADKLETITVYRGQSNRQKEISFIQSYTPAVYMQEAENINGPDFQGTLYLDEVRISGKQAPAVETYTLQYLDKQCFGNHLKGHDVWGYRNAYTFEIPHPNAGTSAVPAHSLSQRYYFYSNYFHDNVVFNFGGNSSQEMPNEQYMKKGVLSRITYPTQGFTVFNFEANRYKVQQSGGPVTRIGGGLRVSSILHYDAGGTTPVSRKHYKYGESEDGTGVLINPPASDTDVEGNITYAGFSYEQVMSYLTGPNDVPGNDTPPFYPIPIDCDNRSCLYPVANETKTTYLPSSFLDFTYANGAPIYYTSVSEYREGSTQLQGKKVYRYYAPDVFHDITVPLWTGSHIEGTNIRRIQTAGFMGMKKAETSYKNVAGTLTPVLKTEYTYERYLRPMMIRVVYAFLKVEFSVVGGNFDGNHFDLYNQSYPLGAGSQPPSDYYESGQYGIAVGRMLLSKTIETDYSGPVPRAKQTEYFYDNAEYTQPSRVRVTDSKGVQLQTTYKYPYDYTGTVYQQMVNKNRIAPVIDEVVNQVSPAKQLSHKETTWGTVSGFQVPILVKQSEKGATLYPTYSYDTYDDKGNLLQVTRKITASINGPRTVYLWGYGKQYPIAEIRNATYATVVAALGGTTVVNNFCNQANPTPQQVRSFLQPLRTNSQLAGALVTTYTHEPHVGLRSKTDEKGSTVHYEYDDFQRLQWIKDNEEYPVQRFHYNYRTP